MAFKLALGIVGFILLSYGLIVILFIVNQDEALFLKPQLSEERASEVMDFHENTVEELEIPTNDGEILHGFYINNVGENDEESGLLIYFGGNAEELSYSIDAFKSIDGWSTLLVNYRGYGLSSGEPNEDKLFEDALLLYDNWVTEGRFEDDQIVVIGRSMGTAPATYLSSQRTVAGTILISPYDTRTRLQKERYPWIFLEPFIRHPFEVSNMAVEIKTPLFAVIGSNDQVIPQEHSEATVERWGGTADKLILEGAHHNNLQEFEHFWPEIEAKLREWRR